MEAEKAELTVALNRFLDRLDHMERSGNNAQITVDAGGVGVWLSAMCCAVMLVCVMMGGLWITSMKASYDIQLQELRSGERAIRAYINTGRLEPVKSEDEEEESDE